MQVSPLKTQTVPRLELMALLLGARVAKRQVDDGGMPLGAVLNQTVAERREMMRIRRSLRKLQPAAGEKPVADPAALQEATLGKLLGLRGKLSADANLSVHPEVDQVLEEVHDLVDDVVSVAVAPVGSGVGPAGGSTDPAGQYTLTLPAVSGKLDKLASWKTALPNQVTGLLDPPNPCPETDLSLELWADEVMAARAAMVRIHRLLRKLQLTPGEQPVPDPGAPKEVTLEEVHIAAVWTDSKAARQWVAMASRRLKALVAACVAEIHELRREL